MHLPPRAHNLLSYFVTALIMVFCADWAQPQVRVLGGLWVFHFLRRSAESLWVHRYSGRPVPPSDYLVEYLYYWGFAYWIATSISELQHGQSSWLTVAGGALFVLGELGNAWAHLALRRLRDARGSDRRSIPKGGPFELVSCPHYSFEICSWLGFALMAQVLGAFAFLLVGSAILSFYAFTRHQNYRKDFDGQEGRETYPPVRKALVPFIF